ncbi:MAG: hypothetical protein VR69_14550 [Peptococcaceae bacterium BRH_c4b]|nr:MAG: hypothetical protein VR69_14550 [Peptococcaceae bacterium BRH_c4b]
MTLLTKEDILRFLNMLNDELQILNIKAELTLFGGSVMCVAFEARPATRDVDAVFKPKSKVYKIANDKIAPIYGLPHNWLNDAVSRYISYFGEKEAFLNLSNLSIYVPKPEYFLAMKCLTSRIDFSSDIEDIKYLLDFLHISSYEQVTEIFDKFYPKGYTLDEVEEIIQKYLNDKVAGDSNGV